MTLDSQKVFKVFHFSFFLSNSVFAHLLFNYLINCMYTDYIYIIPKSPISSPNSSHISPDVSKMYHYFLFITITYIWINMHLQLDESICVANMYIFINPFQRVHSFQVLSFPNSSQILPTHQTVLLFHLSLPQKSKQTPIR